MKSLKPILIVVFLVSGLMTISLIAQTNRTSSAAATTNQTQFEYATLTTQILEGANGEPVYQLTWNAGVVDFVGRSTISLEDARRRLAGQLRIGNNARANLSVLLTGIGQDGWRLIETDPAGEGSTRIFIRANR
jgi:hypothetical protein